MNYNMTDLAKSELVSNYNYSIVADHSELIFCKQECVPVVTPLKENFNSYYPTPHDYMEDLIFRVVEDKVE